MSIFSKHKNTAASLVLADGRVFPGVSFGAIGMALGEVVFNTAMMGYQEILSDPSYAEQMICFTYPHIGNVGTNDDDMESDRVWAKAAIVAQADITSSNYRQTQSLNDFLQQHQVVGIAGVDTRALTRHLRETGAQMGCVISGPDSNIALATERLKQHAGIAGMNLADKVSTQENYRWSEGSWQRPAPDDISLCVVVMDYGVKRSILRLLVDRGCEVVVMPANSSVEAILAQQPHGVLLSNGPGDPAACHAIGATISALLQHDLPVFGICLGFQLLALCLGAKTVKMKFGHHGANHPVQTLQDKRVMITSQNHGFMVDETSLPDEMVLTHRSLFDGSIQGFCHQSRPVFAFQGHPEASPGPQDIELLFDQFKDLMLQYHDCLLKQ